jgi:predicted HAD superfamily Cof-like phosphohydrolase
MSKLSDQVREFHRVFDSPTADKPTVPTDERVRFRLRILAEEFVELLEASLAVDRIDLVEVTHGLSQVIDDMPVRVDLIEVADALADIDYLSEGMRLEFGIDGDPVANEIHRSNLAKVCPDGTVHRRDDGKILKPDGWTPPDIDGVLAKQGAW